MSLLAQIKAGPSHVEVVDWPGAPGRAVALRPLTGAQRAAAQAAALAAVGPAPTDALEQALWSQRHSERLGFEFLARALVDPSDVAQTVASDVDELLAHAESGEVETLLQALLQLEARLSPALQAGSPEALAAKLDELREFADQLGKAGLLGTSSSGAVPSVPSSSSDDLPGSSPTHSSSTSSPASVSKSAPSQPPSRPPRMTVEQPGK